MWFERFWADIYSPFAALIHASNIYSFPKRNTSRLKGATNVKIDWALEPAIEIIVKRDIPQGSCRKDSLLHLLCGNIIKLYKHYK